MTWLFAILSWFILNPTIDSKATINEKEKTTIMYLINKSTYMNECTVTWPVWIKKGTIVLWMTCADKEWVYKARMGIDYENKLFMRKRFYPAQRK